MMKIEVSIIVPVYNVESYLEECLDSIITQSFKEIELILVDDGSTDRSSGIMKSYALKDSRIILLTQLNKGVSAARNAGIRKASGKYILFVDSDDTILPDTVEVLYRQAMKTDADIVIGNAIFCYPDGTQSVFYCRNKTLNNSELRTGDAAYMKLMEYDVFPPLVYLFFIKRQIVSDNKLYFKENIVHEDELWCVKAIFSGQKVLLIDFNYYFYRQRENSIMRSDNIAFRIISLFEVAKELYQYTLELQKSDRSKEAIACIYTRIFWICHFISSLVFQSKINSFSELDYFSGLLMKIYPHLSYSQQRYCLNKFCVSQILCKHRFETDSNLTIYD